MQILGSASQVEFAVEMVGESHIALVEAKGRLWWSYAS